MSGAALLSIDDVQQRADAIVAMTDDALSRDATALADELLELGEAVLLAWLASKGRAPADGEVEGFRLLALHRQGAKGDPSFNACRETCREVVYHRNLILHDPASPDVARTLRLGAMVVAHLALFIGGKLQEAGLGEFCCSSRPVRQPETLNPIAESA
ncbi:hypothetical protein [Oricola sp.]|uniref:hypothetical protein n=1 Tax=Oricola sp. TaxID=1979950 RepID=UPI0025D02BBE|nr:hypothetical protein [Oricola sp.]MCI5076953.1 hypothetical protein [Oricola sp.]